MTNNICLCAGHTKVKVGATNSESGLTEYALNLYLAREVKFRLQSNTIFVSKFEDTRLIRKVELINKAKFDCAIDIHFNAFNSNKKGTLFIFNDTKPQSKLLGDFITQKLICFNVREPISSSVSNRDYFVESCNCPAIVLEVCFIDNSDEVLRFLNNFSLVAEGIAQGIKDFCNYINSGK